MSAQGIAAAINLNQRIVRGSILSALAAVICSGCCMLGGSSSSAPERELQRSSYLEHRVKYPGETLGLISKWYTGNLANWQVITRHNPQLEVNRMQLGSTVLIPSDLVVNNSPLPKRALRQSPNGATAARKSSEENTRARLGRNSEKKLASVAAAAPAAGQEVRAERKLRPVKARLSPEVAARLRPEKWQDPASGQSTGSTGQSNGRILGDIEKSDDEVRREVDHWLAQQVAKSDNHSGASQFATSQFDTDRAGGRLGAQLPANCPPSGGAGSGNVNTATSANTNACVVPGR